MSGMGFEIGCHSICISLTGGLVSLVCLCTQLFSFQKYLQYKPIDRAIILISARGIPMVKNIFISMRTRNYEGMS